MFQMIILNDIYTGKNSATQTMWIQQNNKLKTITIGNLPIYPKPNRISCNYRLIALGKIEYILQKK